MVEEAVRLGLRSIALTDHNGLYGAVRFAEAAVELDMRTVFGAELSLSSAGSRPRTEDPDPVGPHLLVLARGPEGYRRLSRQLAAAHLAGGEKGKLRFDYDALTEAAGGHWHILTGCRKGHVRLPRWPPVGRTWPRRPWPIWWTASAPIGSASS